MSAGTGATLTGQTALVTGSSRGIGRAIALELARQGADVGVCYFQDRKAAEGVAEEIRAAGRKSEVFQVNIAVQQEIERLFDAFTEAFGALDVFVNNAVSANLKPLAELSDRHWDRVLTANLSSFFYAGRRAAELMSRRLDGRPGRPGRPSRTGRIVAVSSLGGRFYVPGYGALSVAKAGIETLARCMAAEWADRGINVNVVCGGPVDTKALDALGEGMDLERFKREMAERTPERRLGTPEDIAAVVAFLCSPAADWIRGQTLTVDGGLSSMLWQDRGGEPE